MGQGLRSWWRAAVSVVLVAGAVGFLVAGAGHGPGSAQTDPARADSTGEGPPVPPPDARDPPLGSTVPAAGGDRPILPPPKRFDGPASPPVPPPAALRRSGPPGAPTGTGVWAVVIGINDYPGSRSDLRSAVADAADVDEALARFGVPGHQRLVLRDRQAGAAVIRAAADWLVRNAGPSATAVFFYAGHVRKLGRVREAIVGADGGVVTDADLAGRLAGLRAAETWVGIAGCYSGGFTELLRPGRVLTAAAGPNDLAYENEEFGRSYLVEYMVRRAMIGRMAPTSVQAAFAWARDAIAREYPARVPVIADASDGDVDLRQPGHRVDPASEEGGSPRAPAASGSPEPTTASSREEEQDSCAELTMGIVRCSG